MLVANILWYFLGDFMLRIMIAGNDRRSEKVALILEESLSDTEVILLRNSEQLSRGADVYLLPIPFSTDGVNINNSALSCTTQKFIKSIKKDALVISAGVNGEGIINMSNRDDFAYKNAVPTAEGAIKLAIDATDKTLADSNILITGFGRVAKLLAHRLFPFSKNIAVAVRKDADKALIDSLGMNAIAIDTLAEHLKRFDIIFNTIPHKIFNIHTLSAAKEGSVFIELASAQSGFDTETIKSLPVNYINAPGLPGKIAPDTAGKIMAETVINIIKENNG